MKNASFSMRIFHRYLGFFLAGIMAVYAISGIVLIFRDTDFLKSKQVKTVNVAAHLTGEKLGKALKMRRFEVEREKGAVIYFKNGEYNTETGVARITTNELPYILNKMTHLHKASSNDPLYWLNVFFGVSLLFFVISAFWMYVPKTKAFKSGVLFSLAGLVLTLILLFI
jgi:hypothetical protein